MDDSEYLLPAGMVRARYNVSDMSIWRWLNDDRLGFPKPLRIHNRRFWRLADLRAWEASQEVSHDGDANA
jgi:predicted DNA-binding transcriptional regulator AlpA